eukprot:527191_1
MDSLPDKSHSPNTLFKTKHQPPDHSLFIQKLKQNKLSFLIEKLKLSDSLPNERTKLIKQASLLLNGSQLQLFESIIDDTYVTSVSKSSIKAPPKPPVPIETRLQLPSPRLTINSVPPVRITTLPLPPLSTSSSTSEKRLTVNPVTAGSLCAPPLPKDANKRKTTYNLTAKPHTETQKQTYPNTKSNHNVSKVAQTQRQNKILGDPKLINGMSFEDKVLQNSLKSIVDAYTKHMNDVREGFQRHQSATSGAIQQINQQLNMLQSQKKYLNGNMANHENQVKRELNEMNLCVKSIHAILHKYKNGEELSIDEWRSTVLDIIASYQQLNAFAPQEKNNTHISDTLNVMGGMAQNVMNNSNNRSGIGPLNNSHTKTLGIVNNSGLLASSAMNSTKKRKMMTAIPPPSNPVQRKKRKLMTQGYPKHLPLTRVLQFNENEFVDYRDFNARYLKSQIMQISYDEGKKHMKFGIHYVGWADKWNVWSIPKYQHRRYGICGTVSERGLHRDCMRYIRMQPPWGDYLEVRPMHLHEHTLFKLQHRPNDSALDRSYVDRYLKWHVAQVILNDSNSAQIQVILLMQNEFGEWYKPQPKADLYWVHLDNEDECAPSNTHILNPTIRKTLHDQKRNV